MHYSTAVDVWSCGCIMAELLTGQVLFPGNGEFDAMSRIWKLLGTPNDSTWPGYRTLGNADKVRVVSDPGGTEGSCEVRTCGECCDLVDIGEGRSIVVSWDDVWPAIYLAQVQSDLCAGSRLQTAWFCADQSGVSPAAAQPPAREVSPLLWPSGPRGVWNTLRPRAGPVEEAADAGSQEAHLCQGCCVPSLVSICLQPGLLSGAADWVVLMSDLVLSSRGASKLDSDSSGSASSPLAAMPLRCQSRGSTSTQDTCLPFCTWS